MKHRIKPLEDEEKSLEESKAACECEEESSDTCTCEKENHEDCCCKGEHSDCKHEHEHECSKNGEHEHGEHCKHNHEHSHHNTSKEEEYLNMARMAANLRAFPFCRRRKTCR